MPSLDWQLDRSGDVTLVELTVRSEFDQHVRIESELTPVWPPRRRGTPLDGWEGNTFEGDLARDQALVLGYATPAVPTEPPARITATAPPSDDESVTPREVVQTLGEESPPRDTLADRRQHETAGHDGTTSDAVTVDSGDVNRESATGDGPNETHGHREEPATEPANTATASPETDAPQQPTAWLDAVESRLATMETLARTSDADEARTAVTELGGIEDVRELQAQLDADRRQLEELQSRSATLAEQLSAVELPLATLERIV